MPKDRQPTALVTSHRVVIGICLSLFVLAWLVFGQTLTHEFVNYDDQAYVFENAQVTSGLTLHGIVWAFTCAHSFNWHPLTWISHMLDGEFFGLNAGGHHFTSTLLHSVAAVLLFLVLREMTNGLWRSAFVAAIFAVHPLHVESVAWVAERKDVLSAVFFFLTIGAYVRYVRDSSRRRYLILLLLFALGLMSKPMLVTLPLVLLILDYWPLARCQKTDVRGQKSARRSQWSGVRGLVVEKIPLFMLSLASCVVTVVVQKHAIAPVDQLPLAPRLANAFLSGAIYLRQMFIPLRLTPLYLLSARSTLSGEVLLSIAVLLVISLAAIALRKERPYLLAGWLWYWVMLLPVLGIVQVGSQAHADRYTYLPHIGLYVMLTWTVADLSRSWPRRREILAGLSGLVVVVLTLLAWKQTSYWRDSESLWRHAITVTPGNHIAFTNLGDSLLKKDHTDEAIGQYQRALELERADSDAENGLGSAFFRKQQVGQAIDHYEKAIALRPEDPEYHNNLGNALCQKGLIDDGITNYRKALELRPDRADLSNAETEFNLANALLRTNHIDEAIAHFRQSLEIQPSDADTHDNLGNAFIRRGLIQEGVLQYQQALELNPKNVRALGDFAWVLATCFDPTFRNGYKAVELSEQARSLSHTRDPVILRTLAAACAEAGQFPQALEAGRSALELAKAGGNQRLIATLEKELALYQTGSTYHEQRR